MQTKSQRALYYELELIADPSARTENHTSQSGWMVVWRAFVNALMTSSEPKVWSSRDWFGHTWWNIYLPQTGQMARFSSPEEARIWLEQNLYSV